MEYIVVHDAHASAHGWIIEENLTMQSLPCHTCAASFFFFENQKMKFLLGIHTCMRN